MIPAKRLVVIRRFGSIHPARGGSDEDRPLFLTTLNRQLKPRICTDSGQQAF